MSNPTSLPEVTREDVEKLKQDWLTDGSWDLYDTEGFEAYRDELKAFQEEQEARRDAEAQRRLKVEAEELGVTPAVMAKIKAFNARAEGQKEQAARLLKHYFEGAGVPVTTDTMAEITSIADCIVDAAVAATQSALLKASASEAHGMQMPEQGQASGQGRQGPERD